MSDNTEAVIRARAVAGDHAGAATAALERYGGELRAFLRAAAGGSELGDEAFAELTEDVWRGLPRFRWDASLRSWLYVIARNALNELRRDPRRRPERHVALSQAPEPIAVPRTVTVEYLRTDVKDGWRALRDALDPAERELLRLRLERELAWPEIAQVVGGSAATLRKRFERIKERLRRLALERGLL